MSEVSRRSDVYHSGPNTAPQFADDMVRGDIDMQRVILLHMDGDTDRLRRIISRGFTPRAVERLRAELTSVPSASSRPPRPTAPVTSSSGCRASCRYAGDRRPPWRAGDEAGQAVPAGPTDDRQRGRSSRTSTAAPRRWNAGLRHADGSDQGGEPGDDIVTALINADFDGEKLRRRIRLLRADARRRGQ